ncbi:hypothetical protein [Polaribacter sp. 20A6]|uniref:hypothetical protein n=1 Tax=Polaribacter sp. 20A6 TaxID=2687289 RepID=UPI0013FDC2ED|nr:hypothetical protein [Polaribacter sp. 20A6]
MVFDTITTEEKFFNFEHPKTYTNLGIAVGMFAFVIISINKVYLEFDFIETVFYPVAVISFIAFIASVFFTMFSKEDILINYTGYLKITSDEFIIDKEKINFTDVVSIKLSVDDYEGRAKNTHSSIKPMYSIGVNNFVTISTDDKKIEKKIQVCSLRETHLISDFLAAQIVKNKFPKANPKQLIAIFSDSFKKTEEGRNYIADQIKSNKIKTIEGLLMMNYSSDEEVKELRKKYNFN